MSNFPTIRGFFATNLHFTRTDRKLEDATKFFNWLGNGFLAPARCLLQGRDVTHVVVDDKVNAFGQFAFFKEKKEESQGIAAIIKKAGKVFASVILVIPCTAIGTLVKGGTLLLSSSLREKYESLEQDRGLEPQEEEFAEIALCIAERDHKRLQEILSKKQEADLPLFLAQLYNKEWFGQESHNFFDDCLPGVKYEDVKEDALRIKEEEIVAQARDVRNEGKKANALGNEELVTHCQKAFVEMLNHAPEDRKPYILAALSDTPEDSNFINAACSTSEAYRVLREQAKEIREKGERIQRFVRDTTLLLKAKAENAALVKCFNTIPPEDLLEVLRALSRQEWMTWDYWSRLPLPPTEIRAIPAELRVPPGLWYIAEHQVEEFIKNKEVRALTDYLENMPPEHRPVLVSRLLKQKWLRESSDDLAFFMRSFLYPCIREKNRNEFIQRLYTIHDTEKELLGLVRFQMSMDHQLQPEDKEFVNKCIEQVSASQ